MKMKALGSMAGWEVKPGLQRKISSVTRCLEGQMWELSENRSWLRHSLQQSAQETGIRYWADAQEWLYCWAASVRLSLEVWFLTLASHKRQEEEFPENVITTASFPRVWFSGSDFMGLYLDVMSFQSFPDESDIKSRLKIPILKAVSHLPTTPLVDDSILTHKFFPEKKISKDPGGGKDWCHKRGMILVSFERPKILSLQEAYTAVESRGWGTCRLFARGNLAPTWGGEPMKYFTPWVRLVQGLTVEELAFPGLRNTVFF